MRAAATSLTRTQSETMNAALKIPNGVRFYRCALQVNQRKSDIYYHREADHLG